MSSDLPENDGPPPKKPRPPGGKYRRQKPSAQNAAEADEYEDEPPMMHVTPTGLVFDGPEDAPATLILAHGAGAPLDHPWMNDMVAALATKGIRIVRFNFPYMQQAQRTGQRKPPNHMDTLLEAYEQVIELVGDPGELYIGGKSMGGRVASMLADDVGAKGVVCLGYPFHPPGQLERVRTEHLYAQKTPTLIVQGTRDPFGTKYEIESYDLAATVRVVFIDDGDHGLCPRKMTGRTQADGLAEAADAVARFIESKERGKSRRSRLVRPKHVIPGQS